MGGVAGFWTPKNEARLRHLHAAGWSTRRIAEQMGITKNTVIGKEHRLGLLKEPAPYTTPNPFPPPRTCLYSYGDPPDADFHFCGEPVDRLGSAWCANHHGKMSVKAEEPVE